MRDDFSAGLYHGRRVILTDAEEVTPANVLDVLHAATIQHDLNRVDIQYLWNVYRGHQRIENREKEVRPEICNKIVENRAAEIVTFKTGYFLGEPVQYVSASADSDDDGIKQLNEYMVEVDKAAKDHELVDWMHIAGVGYRIVLPNTDPTYDSPFDVMTLDPRNTFVVYNSGFSHAPVLGVTYVTRENGDVVYNCYSQTHFFTIINEKVQAEPNFLGGIPIIEYALNTARLGSFEVVLPLLDAINTVDSNRVDAVEQFVQAYLLFKNMDISPDDYDQFRARGAIKFGDRSETMKAEISYITAELGQSETQTLVDHMYNVVLTICGMPNRNGGSSTSDTGAAVIFRDGWSDAEARAKNTELMFRPAEKRFLRVALNIAKYLAGLNLSASAVEINLPRTNSSDKQSKVQVLTTLLASSSVHPLLAFKTCGLFADAQLAYDMSMKYKEEQEQKAREQQQQMGATDEGNNDPEAGSGNRETAEQDRSAGTET